LVYVAAPRRAGRRGDVRPSCVNDRRRGRRRIAPTTHKSVLNDRNADAALSLSLSLSLSSSPAARPSLVVASFLPPYRINTVAAGRAGSSSTERTGLPSVHQRTLGPTVAVGGEITSRPRRRQRCRYCCCCCCCCCVGKWHAPPMSARRRAAATVACSANGCRPPALLFSDRSNRPAVRLRRSRRPTPRRCGLVSAYTRTRRSTEQRGNVLRTAKTFYIQSSDVNSPRCWSNVLHRHARNILLNQRETEQLTWLGGGSQ